MLLQGNCFDPALVLNWCSNCSQLSELHLEFEVLLDSEMCCERMRRTLELVQVQQKAGLVPLTLCIIFLTKILPGILFVTAFYNKIVRYLAGLSCTREIFLRCRPTNGWIECIMLSCLS